MTKGAGSGGFAVPGGDPTSIGSRSELAAALTALRERTGLSVRDLARAVDSPVATVGGYVSGRHLPTVAQSAVFVRILAACGVTDPGAQQAWWDAVARVRRAGAPRPASAVSPYPGLESFQVQDAGMFFGRERVTAQLLAAVRGDATGPPGVPAVAGRMVAVVGPSGSGKSSVVRAGLVRAWAGSGDDSDAPARYSIITPGDRPLRGLAAALLAAGGSGGPGAAGAAGPLDEDEVAAVERSLRADPPGAAVRAPGPDHLLVVDQFEEVFSTCPDERERQAYLAALGAIAGAGPGTGGGPPGPGVLVLRADVYAAALAQAPLLPVLAGAQVVVGPMSPDEVRRAVVEPARIAGCEVDPELVEVLIGDLTPHGAPAGVLDAGALPLLSHALSGTWQRATRRRLTVADYLATGGVAGAVAQSAESVLAALPARQQELAAPMLLRMVNVDDDAVVTRRRMPLTDLAGIAGGGAASRSVTGDPAGDAPPGGEDAAARAVVDRFVAARLMTVDAESVQISHEALLSAWPRLQGWIDESRAALAARRRLDQAIGIWQDSGQDASALLGPTRLAAMQEALTAGSVALSAPEADFLASSEAAVTAARAARVRGRRRRRSIVAVVTTLAVVASGLGVFAVVSGRAAAEQQQAAEAFRDLALAGQVLDAANRVAPQDGNVAAQLALVAFRTSPTAEDRSAVLDATGQPLVTRVLGAKGPTMQALSPDGRLLATADGVDGAIRLLSVTDPERPTVVGTAPAAVARQQFSIAFRPDGRLLATGSSTGLVQLWDV
ncbi:helix-turn-helix domain-containing protein, partial [Nakamurella sp.]|uniref:nSTAND1 domain-containing NTPase n=1 Tax=Nakamurella sp. TaxID=1869182 RepID=UPI003B3B523C